MSIILLLLGCSGNLSQNSETKLSNTSCDNPLDTVILVIESIQFARQTDGVAWGFDIDGLTSDNDDEEGCYHDDLIDPLGNEGIDNAFSALIPTLELTEANAAEGLIQDAINTGELLLMLKISGVDDLFNDDCVTVEVLRGSGTPIIGTEGLILDGQTFDRNEDIPSTVLEEVQIDNGVLTLFPLNMSLPFTILDNYLDFALEDGTIRLDITSGAYTGVLGGATPRSYLEEVVQINEIGITDLLLQLLGTAADLYPDETGECQYISSAFEFSAVPAYLYPTE